MRASGVGGAAQVGGIAVMTHPIRDPGWARMVSWIQPGATSIPNIGRPSSRKGSARDKVKVQGTQPLQETHQPRTYGKAHGSGGHQKTLRTPNNQKGGSPIQMVMRLFRAIMSGSCPLQGDSPGTARGARWLTGFHQVDPNGMSRTSRTRRSGMGPSSAA